jgi:hypothetical protein
MVKVTASQATNVNWKFVVIRQQALGIDDARLMDFIALQKAIMVHRLVFYGHDKNTWPPNLINSGLEANQLSISPIF